MTLIKHPWRLRLPLVCRQNADYRHGGTGLCRPLHDQQLKGSSHAFSNFFGERSLWQRSSRVRKDRHRTIIDVSINLQQRPPSTASTTSSKNAPQAPRTFLELVESKNPRALALLARNLELLKVIRSVWWLHGTGPSQNVAEISITGIGNMLPKEWSWAMEWPLKVLSRDLRPLNSETR